MHNSLFSSSLRPFAVGDPSTQILAVSLGLLLLTFTIGCGTEADETPKIIKPDITTGVAETPTTLASTKSVDTARTGSVGPGKMSMDDLALDEPMPKSTASPSPQADNTESPKGAPDTFEVPQVVLDAPVKKFVDRYDDKTPRQVFEAKVLEDGRIMYHGSFVEYRPDGSKVKAGRYEYSQMDGEWTFWNSEGRVVKQGSYVGNNPEGEWRIFRDDGTLNRIEKYVDGLADGVWTAYRDDGEARLWERSFTAKKPHGVWSEFYEDGTKRLEINYQSGQKHGPLRQWYDNGTLASEVVYANDQRHGMAKEYDVAGNLRNEREWEDGKPKISARN